MLNVKHALVAALAIPALALAAAACNDDADSSSSASQQAVEETNARIQRNEMIWATRELDSLPLHDLNEALDDLEANVPSDAIPTLRNAARILYVTNWDATLKADADAIHEHAVATIGALEANDREATADHMTELHEGWHDFSVTAWDHLAPDAVPEGAGDDHGGETTPGTGHDEGTPAADATADHGHGTEPEATATP